jgi:hypothetical protein
MAAPRLTQFNLARLSRRTGGLDRLAAEYQKQVASMTDEYTKSFSAYQQRVSEQMAPFESAMAQYREVAMPQYQAQVADYNAKLEAYQRQLAELEKDPVIERTERVMVGRNLVGKKKYQNITYYEPKPIPQFATPRVERRELPPADSFMEQIERRFRSARGLNPDYDEVTVYDPIKAPEAPEVPNLPQLEQFDSSKFENKRSQLAQNVQREVGERRAARMNVTKRGALRPLLRGEQA